MCLPQYEENYIQRIGRTARASGKDGTYEEGVAITLVMKEQISIMSRIEAIMNRGIKKRQLPQRQQRYNSRRPRQDTQREVKHQRRNFLY